MDEQPAVVQPDKMPDEAEINKLMNMAKDQYIYFEKNVKEKRAEIIDFTLTRGIREEDEKAEQKPGPGNNKRIKTKSEIEDRFRELHEQLLGGSKGGLLVWIRNLIITVKTGKIWLGPAGNDVSSSLQSVLNTGKETIERELNGLQEDYQEVLKNISDINGSLSERHKLLMDYMLNSDMALMDDLARLNESKVSEMDGIAQDLKKMTDMMTSAVQIMRSKSIVPE